MSPGNTELQLTDVSTISIPTDAILILSLLILFPLLGYFFQRILDKQTNQFIQEVDDHIHLELGKEKLEDQLTILPAIVNNEQSKTQSIKKSKFIKLYHLDTSNSLILNKIKKYDLVINSENKNFISNKFFTNKIKKNYRSRAYTFIINHSRKDNDIAIQVFTKFGPLAFLPLSNTKTSIVFSYKGVKIDDGKIVDIFKKYNSFYSFAKINKIENFSLSFEMLRNYTYNNILAFGDLIHRIHPLAGQGFNMTIRDIKIISRLVNDRISLGLPIDISVAEDFQSSTKHLNYLYGKAIDGIYEFFRLDSNIKNSISKPVFSILNKNSIFKKYSNILSDKGLNL